MRIKSSFFLLNIVMLVMLGLITFSCNKDEADDPLVLVEVKTIAVSEISTSSGTTGGVISSNSIGNVTERGVCWSTSENPNINDNIIKNGPGMGTFVSKLYGLEDSTTFYVRAYATNGAGTAYGNQVVFKTPPRLPVKLIAKIDDIQFTATNPMTFFENSTRRLIIDGYENDAEIIIKIPHIIQGVALGTHNLTSVSDYSIEYYKQGNNYRSVSGFIKIDSYIISSGEIIGTFACTVEGGISITNGSFTVYPHTL